MIRMVDFRTIDIHWTTADQLPCPQVTIGELPDDILLDIFSFYLNHQRDSEDAWHALVHVCRRWRCRMYASPRRLRLRLLCTGKRPIKEALDVWPELPIVIHAGEFNPTRIQTLETNVIAALEHHDRVCDIHIDDVHPTLLLKMFSVMKKPFPSLINLEIISDLFHEPSTFPDSFLGGSAPRLQSLAFYNILLPSPQIGKLLLSARNITFLCFDLILRSGPGCPSPEAMVNGLSVLTRLTSLRLTFNLDTLQPQSQQSSGHPPPSVRVDLPALTEISFHGDKQYVEDVVSRIDTPLLANITINLFDRSMLVTSPFRDFISRTENFGACPKIYTNTSDGRIEIKFLR